MATEPIVAPLPPPTALAQPPQGGWRLGVIGDPIAHSISPALQGAALNALSIPATYERWHTPLDELPGRITSLRAADALGANVTVPHKAAVMPLLDAITPLAARAGAVNTIIHRDDHLHGDNTDVYGFATSLLDECPDVAGRSVIILGAGGAARGVILALESLDVTEITVANRNPVRASQLARDLTPTNLHVIEWSPASIRGTFAQASIIVNTTPVGWHAGEIPIDLDLLDEVPSESLIVDLTYVDTDFLKGARARGLRTLDGLGMLIHQGARAFELWTGQAPPVDAMRVAALAARG